MDPITIGAAVAVAKLGSDAYNAWEDGRAQGKYNKKARQKLAEIEKLFKEIMPPDYNLDITAPPNLVMEELQKPKYREFFNRPQYDKSTIKRLGKFAPQAAKMIKEDAPQLIKENETTLRGKEAQTKALDRLDKIASSSSDPEFRLLVERAKKRAQSEAQSRGKSLESQYARRGMLGSGLQMAAQLGSDAEAMDRLGEMEMQASADAYRNRLNALMQGAELGGRMRREDQDVQSRNNALINEFNQRMSTRRQDLENRNVDRMNEGQLYNLKEDQRLAEANRRRMDNIIGADRRAAEFDIQREDRNLDRDYERRAREREYLNNLRKYRREWEEGQRRYGNTLRDQEFRNKMAKANAIAGRGDASLNQMRGETMDAMNRRRQWGEIGKGALDLGMNYYMKRPPAGSKGGESYPGEWEDDYDYY